MTDSQEWLWDILFGDIFSEEAKEYVDKMLEEMKEEPGESGEADEGPNAAD